MTLASEIARHLRAVYFGGNWTSVNFKDILSNINHIQATTKLGELHTIAGLTYHTNYYITGVNKVLLGGKLETRDQFSFDCPILETEVDWQRLVKKSLADAEEFAGHIEHLDDDLFAKHFVDKKFGSYYGNLNGIIEHCHYHLGQIMVIKKLIENT